MQRFWQKVDRKSPDECWPWIGYKEIDGYGRVKINGKKMLAHRVSFFLTYGYYPPVVMHRCDNPPCCNPAHLKGGSQVDNVEDMLKKGRAPRNGIKNSQSKLTEGLVICIRELSKRKIKQKELAVLFGVDPTTISLIIKRKTWTHI